MTRTCTPFTSHTGTQRTQVLVRYGGSGTKTPLRGTILNFKFSEKNWSYSWTYRPKNTTVRYLVSIRTMFTSDTFSLRGTVRGLGAPQNIHNFGYPTSKTKLISELPPLDILCTGGQLLPYSEWWVRWSEHPQICPQKFRKFSPRLLTHLECPHKKFRFYRILRGHRPLPNAEDRVRISAPCPELGAPKNFQWWKFWGKITEFTKLIASPACACSRHLRRSLPVQKIIFEKCPIFEILGTIYLPNFGLFLAQNRHCGATYRIFCRYLTAKRYPGLSRSTFVSGTFALRGTVFELGAPKQSSTGNAIFGLCLFRGPSCTCRRFLRGL